LGQVTVHLTLTNARELVTSHLGNLAPEAVHTGEVEALIDTEHTPSVVPEALAGRLNLVWWRRETWRPDGRWGEAEVTEPVQVELFGRPATIEALVMGEQVRLGATVLTSTDLRWDAASGELLPYLGTWEQPVFRV
jgi:hypothetical protein